LRGAAILTRLALLLLGWSATAAQAQPPLLDPAHGSAIAAEVSGSGAKRTIQAMSMHHRMRGSEGFRAAAELVRDRLKDHGLQEVGIISLPADGKIFYGTQRSRPAWNASFAELWEQRQEGGRWSDSVRIASWAEQPISLAQDSVSGRAEAELVDVGAGTSAGDYAGKDVRGKLVLISSQPEAAAPLAIGEHKAAGIVSWAQNQRQAWWGEDESLIRWGHLSSWKHPTFAFMVSPARAREWQQRLGRGEQVRLRAEVQAGRTPAAYLIPTALIPGRDRSKEIVFSCHLDHPSPGTNDNASGCAGILEVARSLGRLIREGRLPQPRRSIRFIWPAEIEGTIALLNARPEFARRTLATVHLDMIGGNTEITKSVLKVEGSPPSLPSFVGDIGFGIARWVNEQSRLYADEGAAPFPLTDPEGDKRPLQANVGGFSEGSDHQVWAEGSWRVPVIYIADWPDRYIHTQKDVPANIDATKLKRAIFIAAASAWALANLDETALPRLTPLMEAEAAERRAAAIRRASALPAGEAVNFWRHQSNYEAGVASSLARFDLPARAAAPSVGRAAGEGPVYRRVASLKGPMNAFGYSWLDDQLEQKRLERPALLSRTPTSEGASFGYEALNLVDGRRTVGQIRDDLAATVGPVPLEEVAAFLATLARLGVVETAR
jgi:hypothetical protein